jgi:hypothetical protein
MDEDQEQRACRLEEYCTPALEGLVQLDEADFPAHLGVVYSCF